MTYLPFHIDYLTKPMMEKAEDELGETCDMRKEALQKFRNLLKDDPKHVYYCPMDDTYLLQFLRARKFNVKRALSLIYNYYHVKKHYSDIYRPDMDGFRKNVYDQLINVLPYRDEEGCALCIVQLYNWNVNEMKFASFIHGISSALMACIDLHPATQICGMRFIVDAKGLGLKHVRHVSPKEIHLIAKGLMNCLPVRFKEIHIFNESIIIQYIWNIINLVLSEKIKNRVYFHASSIESLHKRWNPSLLPTEYGGTLDYDNSFWLQTVEDFEDRYHTLMSYGLRSKKASHDESPISPK